jgi:hypothetical protein
MREYKSKSELWPTVHGPQTRTYEDCLKSVRDQLSPIAFNIHSRTASRVNMIINRRILDILVRELSKSTYDVYNNAR